MKKGMRGMKIYLSLVTVLLVLAIGSGIYVWYKLQTLQLAPSELMPAPSHSSTDTPAVNSTTAGATATGTIQISTNELSDSQKVTLRAFGIDPNAFTLTENMVTCAKETLGSARFDEVKAGASPTPFEAFKLMKCVK
jgi:hypothetical protein